MDPYLESPTVWGDFHSEFIGAWRAAIAGQLPHGYDARVNQRVCLVEPGEPQRRIGPDVFVTARAERSGATSVRTAPGGSTALLEPVDIPLVVDLDTAYEPFIEIRLLPGRQIVAVLELLSPSNKTGDDRIEYLRKRDEVIRSNAHLVELDLLLGGRRVPMRKAIPDGDYYAFVSRAERRPMCDVYAWDLRRVLPPIPIPLKQPDPDVVVDLGKVFEAAYQRGYYDNVIDYGAPPAASVREGDAGWVRGIASTVP